MKQFFAVLLITILFFQCTTPGSKKSVIPITSPTPSKDTAQKINYKAVLLKKQVPVLCFHHIQNWKPKEKNSLKLLLDPIDNFDAQIKSLADSGYQTITPDEYYAYLTKGAILPPKPVMITFDDTNKDQYTYGVPELNKYNFKGVFFITTIAIGRREYMSADELKELSDDGHVIAAHTWRHKPVTKLKTSKDMDSELLQPRLQLESITGKPVDCFAYPYGILDSSIFTQLEKDGYTCAYQLAQFKRDSNYPLYTLRRIIVPGPWDGRTMQKMMNRDF